MALLHSLCSIRSRGVLRFDLVCGHVNHRLRGPESEADESFVRSAAGLLAVPFVCTAVDVTGLSRSRGLSIETAARILRMQALQDLSLQTGCHVIALGHQKNDNAETLVHRLLRGAGLRGLAAIWPLRTTSEGLRIIRPLLGVDRAEVLEFLRARDLAWQEDSTNSDCRFTRNAIRHQLLPRLQQDSRSSLTDGLSDLALAAYGLVHHTLTPAVDRLWQAAVSSRADGLALDLKALAAERPYVQAELIRRALTSLGCGERDLAEVHYKGLLNLIRPRARLKAVSLPRGFVARRERSCLRIGSPARPTPAASQEGPVMLPVPGTGRIGPWLVETVIQGIGDIDPTVIRSNRSHTTEWLDAGRLRPPLVLRFPRPGDRFQALGQSSEKKVARFLIDERTDRQSRSHILVVEDQDRIVWVCPVRISDRVKVTAATRRIVRISVKPE
jgi:tRNA(Ile)-lysidine synthase